MLICPGPPVMLCDLLKTSLRAFSHCILVRSAAFLFSQLQKFGAFVGIDNTQMSALLHISNVSQGHLDHVQVIFNTNLR